MTNKNLLIELIYNDELVLQGESLYESGAVTNIALVDQGLFSGQVKDGKIYEVEIQSPFLKKQKSSCECTFFTENQICKHVIAFLFELRTIHNNQEKVKTEQLVIQPAKHSTLNITNILQSVEFEELVNFVKNYAKTDKKFSTLLKVNFARKIDLADNAVKYKSILNSLVRPYSGTTAKASASEIKSAANVIEDFGAQIHDSLALGHYLEAFNIYENSFSKLVYIRHYYQHHSEFLSGLNITYHKLIETFFAEKLPPDLKKELISFLLDLANRSYYHFEDAFYNILHLLSAYSDKSGIENIKAITLDLRSGKPASEAAILQALYHKLMKKINKSDLDFYSEHTIAIKDVIDHLLTMQEEKLALQFLRTIDSPNKFDREISNRLIYLNIRLQDRKALFSSALKALVLSGDLKYYDILKKEAPIDEWKHWFEQIENAILKRDVGPEILSKLYRKEDKVTELIQLLESRNDLKIIQIHDSFLYKTDRIALIEMYKEVVYHHLSTHIGEKSNQYMKEIIRHLKANGMKAVIESLEKFLSENFAHRLVLSDVFE